MRRIYVKRFAAVFFTVAAIYLLARTLNSGGRMHTKWFFEYSETALASGWPPAAAQGSISRRRGSAANHGPSSRSATPVVLGSDAATPGRQFLSITKCPVCFGRDLCPQIESGTLMVDATNMVLVAGKPHKVAFRGAWHTMNAVNVKSLVPSEFSLLGRHLCRLKGQPDNVECDLDAKTSVSPGGGLITLESVRQLHRDVKKTRSDIPIAICANEKLLSAVKRVFDEDQDGVLSDYEEIVLFSTLASNPELVVLKFLTKFIPSLPFPQYFGSCGRVFVVEGGVTPLKDFINEPFHIRASLGAQMLQMVDDFIADEDSEWFVMFTDFSFDNLGVNKDGEVVIMDVEDMVVVDKKIIKSDVYERTQRNHSREPCNEHCLRIFSQQILHSANPSKSCASIQRYSHLMYAALCQRVLSYLEEHRVEDFFNSDSYSHSRGLPYPGLLHSPPNKDKTAIEELLQECVQETAYGGRIQAAEELRDYLSEFFQDDDDDDGGSDEEGPRNDAAEYDVNETGRNR